MVNRQLLKLNVFKNMCVELSGLSHDTKFKVGAIIITNDYREICAMGYNGNYKGGKNERDSMETGASGFLHAEENALYHLCKPYELRDNLLMICTHKPCPMCAKRIVNSGIKKVFYVNQYDALGPGTDQIFKSSNVDCLQL